MRVTDQMVFTAGQASIGKAREQLARATDAVSSGLRVQHPWDDPASAALLSTHRINERKFDAIRESIGRATDELNASDGALSELSHLLGRANELAVQLSNDTYSANDRAGAAKEVEHLFRAAVGVLNTEVGGRYLFGGLKDRAPPFDSTGAYVGDSGVRSIEIAPGVYLEASIRADVALKGVGGGVDVLGALEALRVALSTNDVDAVRASIEPLRSGISQVTLARSQVGAAASTLESAELVALTARDDSTRWASREGDADPFEAASALAFAERALEAAVSATAKSFSLSLLNKLP